jgi:hypothetical protein
MPLTTSTMKSKYLTILGFGALLAVVGCHPAPNDVPADGCRLTVEDIVTNGDMRVAQLAIVSSATCTIAIDADLSHMSVVTAKLADSPSVSGSVTLVADRIAPSGQAWAYFHTLIRAQAANGGAAGGPAFDALPIDTPPSGFFTVTAKSGDYSFDTPVEIATLRGKPVTLTFKRTTK